MLSKKNNDPSFSEELPYWDFFDLPKPHLVLNDGSLVTGLKVTLKDIECLDDEEINQFTNGLRSTLNSISEGVTVQFLISVRSNFQNVIKLHSEGKSGNIHPLISKIAEYRESKLSDSLENGELYRPELFIFLRTPMIEAKKIAFFKKRELFSAKVNDSY